LQSTACRGAAEPVSYPHPPPASGARHPLPQCGRGGTPAHWRRGGCCFMLCCRPIRPSGASSSISRMSLRLQRTLPRRSAFSASLRSVATCSRPLAAADLYLLLEQRCGRATSSTDIGEDGGRTFVEDPHHLLGDERDRALHRPGESLTPYRPLGDILAGRLAQCRDGLRLSGFHGIDEAPPWPVSPAAVVTAR
jgi:hypothetical protein